MGEEKEPAGQFKCRFAEQKAAERPATGASRWGGWLGTKG
jgi:hypothetical protein